VTSYIAYKDIFGQLRLMLIGSYAPKRSVSSYLNVELRRSSNSYVLESMSQMLVD
jgi:hypothetical protein